MTKKTSEIVFDVISWLLIIVFLVVIVKFVFIPSYHSVVLACYPEQADDDIRIGGEILFNVSECNDDIYTFTIKVYTDDPRTLKHEIIHLHQFYRNPLWQSCDYVVLKYITELEAYSGSYLPNEVFKILYPIEVEILNKIKH